MLHYFQCCFLVNYEFEGEHDTYSIIDDGI
jgi:hypothetical protein